MKNVTSVFVLIAFVFSCIMPPAGFAQVLANTGLPVPGTIIAASPAFMPAQLKGIMIDPKNALKFDFIIHKGDQPLVGDQKSLEYKKLIKYFLAALTVPDQDQWVNLSPYEGDRIIKEDFGMTEMGRDLLAQDYILKQLTASLIHPDTDMGKRFWDRVYKKAHEAFGTTEIPMNAFNKVWITPEKAVVWEKDNTAYILESHLKVLTEQDYVSLQKNSDSSTFGTDQLSKSAVSDVAKVSGDIVREILIPELEREVNEGKNFANLRQIYSGMVLATWYKKALKESLLGKVYADRAKVKGVDQDPKNNDAIYQQYVAAFKKGVFNLIKEDVDQYSQELIPRKYFSGGWTPNDDAQKVVKGDKDSLSPEYLRRVQETIDEIEIGSIDDVLIQVTPAAQGENDEDALYVPSEGLVSPVMVPASNNGAVSHPADIPFGEPMPAQGTEGASDKTPGILLNVDDHLPTSIQEALARYAVDYNEDPKARERNVERKNKLLNRVFESLKGFEPDTYPSVSLETIKAYKDVQAEGFAGVLLGDLLFIYVVDKMIAQKYEDVLSRYKKELERSANDAKKYEEAVEKVKDLRIKLMSILTAFRNNSDKGSFFLLVKTVTGEEKLADAEHVKVAEALAAYQVFDKEVAESLGKQADLKGSSVFVPLAVYSSSLDSDVQEHGQQLFVNVTEKLLTDTRNGPGGLKATEALVVFLSHLWDSFFVRHSTTENEQVGHDVSEAYFDYEKAIKEANGDPVEMGQLRSLLKGVTIAEPVASDTIVRTLRFDDHLVDVVGRKMAARIDDNDIRINHKISGPTIAFFEMDNESKDPSFILELTGIEGKVGVRMHDIKNSLLPAELHAVKVSPLDDQAFFRIAASQDETSDFIIVAQRMSPDVVDIKDVHVVNVAEAEKAFEKAKVAFISKHEELGLVEGGEYGDPLVIPGEAPFYPKKISATRIEVFQQVGEERVLRFWLESRDSKVVLHKKKDRDIRENMYADSDLYEEDKDFKLIFMQSPYGQPFNLQVSKKGNALGRIYFLDVEGEPFNKDKDGSFDAAQGAKKDKAFTRGGIDLNAKGMDMQIKRDGAGVPLPVSQQDIENIRIDGFMPVILDIRPATNLPLFSQATAAAASSV